MKYNILLLTLLLCLAEYGQAQVVNRYPVVQRPSQTTATIAWRRATPAIGTLYLGNASGIWFDSISTTGPEQKPYFDLAGLQANLRYYYQVKSIAPGDTFISNIESFYTAPIDTVNRLSFVAYGDCGYNNSTQNQVKGWMEQEIVDFGLVTGDVDQGVGDAYDNVFFGVYRDMLKKSCHFTCIGNHDTYYDGAATYLDAFYLFSNNPQNSERYYSFKWGDAKFISLDANIDYSVGSPQYNWLIDELRCNDKKWLFVFFHQPPWTNAWSADYYIPFTTYFLYQGNTDMRTILVPEFERYGVDFVVNGHSHCYQRGAMNGVQYLITGGAGASTLDAHTNSNSPNISVEIYRNHYVRFDITGDTAKYVMVNDNGGHMDSVTVVKSYTHFNHSISSVDASCNGINDGQISLSVTGPAIRSPYTFLWSNGATTANLSGLSGGQYTVVIRDALGCERMDTVLINGIVTISTQMTASDSTLLICDDNNPITLSAAGNHPAYLWSTGETTSSIQVLNGNTYTVTAYDANGCASLPVSMTVSALNSPANTDVQYTINGLTVNFTGSNGDTYFWDFGDGGISGQATTSHTYTSDGQYNVQVIITNACGVDTFQYVVVVGNPTGTVSLTTNADEWKVTIQPNPFKEFAMLTFHNPKGLAFDLFITDIQGREVRAYRSITQNSVQIDKANLPAGTYFYRLSDGKVSVSGQLVVE